MRKSDNENGLLEWLMLPFMVVAGCLLAVVYGVGMMLAWAFSLVKRG